MSCGNSSVASISAARGSMRSSAIFRTSLRNCSSSSGSVKIASLMGSMLRRVAGRVDQVAQPGAVGLILHGHPELLGHATGGGVLRTDQRDEPGHAELAYRAVAVRERGFRGDPPPPVRS